MRGIAGFAAFVALLAISSAQIPGSQEFLQGLHYGLELEPNIEVIFVNINDRQLNPRTVGQYLDQAASDNQDTQLTGLQNLKDIFTKFESVAHDIIQMDSNFITAVNYTLTVLASPQGFINRAEEYRRQTKVDLFENLKEAGTYASLGNYFFSGFSFGSVISQLKDIFAEKDSLASQFPLNKKSMEILTTRITDILRARQ